MTRRHRDSLIAYAWLCLVCAAYVWALGRAHVFDRWLAAWGW